MRTLPVLLALLLAGCTGGSSTPETAATDSVQVRLVRDTLSGADLPRVTLPARPDVERRVNASLDSLSASLRCEDADAADTTFDTRASTAYAGDDVLSVSVHAAYYCGGPYPTNDANLSVTYDLTTGREVPFEALWRDYAADRDVLLGLFSASLQTGPFDTAGADDCRDVLTPELLAQNGFAYTLTKDGLTVQPDFPHVVEACANEAVLPYASVRAFAAEGSVLARVADHPLSP